MEGKKATNSKSLHYFNTIISNIIIWKEKKNILGREIPESIAMCNMALFKFEVAFF